MIRFLRYGYLEGKLFYVVFICFIILGAIGASNPKSLQTNQSNQFVETDTMRIIDPQFVDILLEDNLSNDIVLMFNLGKSANGNYVVSGKPWVSVRGLVAGFDFNRNFESINIRIAEGRISYQVVMEVKWFLLWFPIYSQTKSFEGSLGISDVLDRAIFKF